METTEYHYSQEILDELSNTSSFNYDLLNEKEKKEYAHLFDKEKINRPLVNHYIFKVFKHKKDLKFAYHVTSLNQNNDGIVYMQLKIYYFRTEGPMLRFIKQIEPDTFDHMNLENLSLNTFIHLNQD